MESNDSPEIPDREETSDIPGLPLGAQIHKRIDKSRNKKTKTISFVVFMIFERKADLSWDH